MTRLSEWVKSIAQLLAELSLIAVWMIICGVVPIKWLTISLFIFGISAITWLFIQIRCRLFTQSKDDEIVKGMNGRLSEIAKRKGHVRFEQN